MLETGLGRRRRARLAWVRGSGGEWLGWLRGRGACAGTTADGLAPAEPLENGGASSGSSSSRCSYFMSLLVFFALLLLRGSKLRHQGIACCLLLLLRRIRSIVIALGLAGNIHIGAVGHERVIDCCGRFVVTVAVTLIMVSSS